MTKRIIVCDHCGREVPLGGVNDPYARMIALAVPRPVGPRDMWELCSLACLSAKLKGIHPQLHFVAPAFAIEPNGYVEACATEGAVIPTISDATDRVPAGGPL